MRFVSPPLLAAVLIGQCLGQLPKVPIDVAEKAIKGVEKGIDDITKDL